MCQKCDYSSYHPILYGHAFQMPEYGEKVSLLQVAILYGLAFQMSKYGYEMIFLQVVMTIGRFLHSHALNVTLGGINPTILTLTCSSQHVEQSYKVSFEVSKHSARSNQEKKRVLAAKNSVACIPPTPFKSHPYL